MANIKEYIKKVMDGTVSLEEQQAALAQVEKTIVEAKQRRDESVGQKADMVVQALKTIEAKLEAKLVELNNTPAMQGVQGPTGKAGKDGIDGKDGLNGVSGKDGKDGVNGVDGKDGISVVDAKIDFDGSLVVYLSNGDEIDCGQILSPDVAQNIIISSGGSGTSQAVTDTLVSLQTQINTLTGIDGTLGTMAQQDANAVAITGGTIDNTTVGSITPSTVNATTLSGETGVLRGTGSNLILNSQGIGGTSWVNSGTATSTQNSAVAPDLTTTASTITSASNLTFGGNNTRSASTNIVSGTTYTASCYVKLGTATTCSIGLRDNSTGTVVSSTTTTAGSWVRLTATITYGSSTTSTVLILGNADGTFFAWGAQLELGSTANTYIPTTTTAVYGTPTLSFSGVSTIGLQSNGALFLQPAGTGAIQAQATTSTAAGGNARGANAVDWQTARSAASQVASASFSVVSGGSTNTASNTVSTVSGGFTNTASAYASVVSGGQSNTASGQYSVISGGASNTSAGFYNVINGGFTNAGTALAAVTTQSGTMNATTAVTLSGSNANIKVGQYITGTSIAGDTYVAAISGTALTLSKVASGSSTSTLSFFTPHGVVVGGGNNQATGSYSFIGGGGDAGTAANRNVASGAWSAVVGGNKNTASGLGSFIGGNGGDGAAFYANTASGVSSAIVCGTNNTTSGLAGFIGAGITNNATATYGFIGSGNSNTANGFASAIVGGVHGNTRSIAGNQVFPACVTPIANASGVSQTALLVLAKQTTDATPTALCSDPNAAGTGNQVILPNNSAYFFRGEVVSGVTGGGNTKGWTIEGVIKRGANAASTALVGTPQVVSSFADVGAATWAIAVTADTTNGGLRVTFTGQAATTIRTVCQIRTTEMTY